MCGIVGLVGKAPATVVQQMTQALAHRGPDDQGLYLDEANGVALGNRRLAIIDLSPAGHQPMSYADGRYWISYNGEVYNFADIRQELEKLGYTFRSRSDTEVVLAAYAQWGTACLERFRGMFAFAIWDREKRELFLARDRFGIKPLLYAQVAGLFLFASEMKALLASGLIERRADKQAIWDYLSLGSVPQPRTILSQVRALPPGCWLRLKPGGDLQIQRYWDIAAAAEPRRQHVPQWEEARRELRRLLEEATRLHMIADVPVGAFLSGGTDSTAMVGLMSQHVPRPLKTYSIGFEAQHARLSELSWAKIAAERFGTDHTEVVVTDADAAGMFEALVEALDQPSHDGANTYLVSRAARQGVTVALSGLGGDELFAGYPQFARYVRWLRWAPGGIPLLGKLGGALPGRFRYLLQYASANPLGRAASVRRLYNEQEKRAITAPLFRNGFRPCPLEDFYASRFRDDLDPIAQVSYMEIMGYLSDTLLRDTDATSMAHALEVRPVLLDHVFAEYAFALPASMKLYNGQTKALLIDALRDILPAEIAARRKKMYFSLPLLAWLRGPLRERALGLLDGHSARDLFTPDFLRHCSQGLRGEGKALPGLWAIVVLLAWLERFQVQAA